MAQVLFDSVYGDASSAAFSKTVVGSINSNRVAPNERLKYWRNQVDELSGLDVICGTSNFVGRMETRHLGLCTIHGVNIETPHRAVREKSDADLIFVNLQLKNDGARYSGRREVTIGKGSMFIYEAREPYELDFTGKSESLILALPRLELQKRVTNLQLHIDEAIEYETGNIELLSGLMRGILGTRRNAPQAVRDGMAEAAINLLVATLYNSSEANACVPTFGVAATLQRIRAFINENISDPNLSPVVTSEAMGITVSYLHKIFLQNNTTMMQYVLKERLERCRKDIAKTDRSGGISQIAYNWGFNDASHFSRSFRKHFGMSAREYRQSVIERNERLANGNA